MLIPEGQIRIWLYGPPTDMRKSFDGLAALVRTRLKALYFDRGGYCVWSKRLEQGQFHPVGLGDKRRLDWTELKLILDGIDLRSVRRFKRYHHPAAAQSSV